MGDITTIPVHKTTRDKLKLLGIKGETYDQIINKLIKRVNYEEFMERQYRLLSEKDAFVPLDEVEW